MIDIEIIIRIAREAGKKILEIYEHTYFGERVEKKADESPLTLADKESHALIERELKKIYPSIPVLSEEGSDIAYEERSQWNEYWLVDPLDGTKEFIKRNGEFTINIALIRERYPVAGLIYAPASNVMYYAVHGKAYVERNNSKTVIKVNNKSKSLIAIGSRSHSSPEEDIIFSRYDIAEKKTIGSSLKFCWIAEGKADIYYRHSPTMEWDTAAGQAIVEAAGGSMKDEYNRRFIYNKENLKNGSFLCSCILDEMK